MKLHRGLMVVALGLINVSALALADETGIAVSATGEAVVKPNRLEIEVKAGASAELTADAVVKYRDGLRRAKEAFEKLKIDNLQVVDRGMNVANAAAGPANNQAFVVMNGGGPAAAAKPEVNISKSLRLAVTGIDKLSEEQLVALVAKLLDTAKDAGVVTGGDSNNSLMMRLNGMNTPSTMVTFIADDSAAARKLASEDAFRQAKEKAQRLADLAGAKLGSVLSMEETAFGSGSESIQEKVIRMAYGGGALTQEETRLTSPLLVDLPVHVSLRVRFALEPKAGGAAK